MKTGARQTDKKLAGEKKNKPIQRRIMGIDKAWQQSLLRRRVDVAPSKSRRVGMWRELVDGCAYTVTQLVDCRAASLRWQQ